VRRKSSLHTKSTSVVSATFPTRIWREIEDLLLRHGAIREVAVFGVPDRLWGEAVTAAMVGADGLTPDEVIAFCRGSMADYKCPKHVHICSELPKNEYGKVLKRELRKRYADGIGEIMR
jgi:acyl-CoA synthetase (AMP-forming)/AMP-acid ligase II